MMSDGESDGESYAAHENNHESGGDSEQQNDGSDDESVDEGYDQEAGDYSNANEGIYDVVDDDEDDVDDDDDNGDDDDDYGYGWDEDDNFPPGLPSYVEADVTNQMTIVFNRGPKRSWSQIKKEVTYFRNIYGMGADAQANIFDKLFGRDSEFFFVWRRILKRTSNYNEFCKFFATFFIECCFRCNYQFLYDSSEFDTSNYLESKRYTEIWRMIDEYNRLDDFTLRAWEEFEEAVNNNCKDSFVPTKDEFVQTVSIDDDKVHHNRTIRTKDQPLNENNTLARKRHTRDNANGLVAHVVAYPGSGVPIHVRFARKGETEYHCLMKALQFMFNYSESNNTIDLSQKLLIAADRGYWNKDSLRYVLERGADVIGTIQRQLFYPYTFGKKETNEDPNRPHNIETNGPACVYQKSARFTLDKMSNRNLTATAWYNGTSSSAALTLTSLQDESTASKRTIIDVIFEHQNASVWFESKDLSYRDRAMKGFSYLCGAYDLIHCDIITQNVYPLTETQTDPAWFLMRCLAMTSSTMNSYIRQKAKTIDLSHPVRRQYDLVLDYSNTNISCMPRAECDDDNNNDSSNSDMDDIAVDDDGNWSIGDETVLSMMNENEDYLHRYTYKLANSNDSDNNIAMNQSDDDERNSDDSSESTYDGSNSTEAAHDNNRNLFSGQLTADEFMNPFFDYTSSDEFEMLRKSEAADIIPDLTDDFISVCLNMITNKGKSAEDRRAMLTKWIQATRPQRAVMFLSRKELEALAEERGLKEEMKWTTGNLEELKKRLARLINISEYDGLDGDADGDNEQRTPPHQTTYHSEFLSQMFMSRLKAGSDEGMARYAAKGHQAEPAFISEYFEAMESLHENQMSALGACKVDAIYRPGLVYNKMMYSLRDSSDGVAIITSDNYQPYAAPIEVKSRCSVNTCKQEEQNILYLKHDNTNTEFYMEYEHSGHDCVVATIRSHLLDDDNNVICVNPILHKVIPNTNELIQLLHHAVTYNTATCIFLVGNDKHLMAIYHVIFAEELLLAYEEICADFYETDLKVFYEPGKGLPTIPKEWMDALLSPKLLKRHVTEKSFRYQVAFWREFNIEYKKNERSNGGVMQRRFPFPVPMVAHFVPGVVAYWNGLKGGGDTLTKQIDNQHERLGVRSENTTACGRLFLYAAIHYSRICQWCYAKSNLNFYPSAAHARRANSTRFTVQRSLKMLIDDLLRQTTTSQRDSSGGLGSTEEDVLHIGSLMPSPTRYAQGTSPVIASGTTTRMTANKTPSPMYVGVASVITKQTPTHRSNRRSISTDRGARDVFQNRCDSCLGILYMRRMPDPSPSNKDASDDDNDDDSDDERKSTTKSRTKKSMKKGNQKAADSARMRKKCFICGTRTEYYCPGCRRWLCFAVPKYDEPKKSSKDPKLFALKAPILDRNGELEMIPEGRSSSRIKSETEFGQWTCYHKAHYKKWMEYLVENAPNLRGTERKRLRSTTI